MCLKYSTNVQRCNNKSLNSRRFNNTPGDNYPSANNCGSLSELRHLVHVGQSLKAGSCMTCGENEKISEYRVLIKPYFKKKEHSNKYDKYNTIEVATHETIEKSTIRYWPIRD